MEMMESRIANLENLRKAGTIVLSVKDSQKDIFNKEYRQALIAINHIVEPIRCHATHAQTKKRLA